jgi:hypothetical protein
MFNTNELSGSQVTLKCLIENGRIMASNSVVVAAWSDLIMSTFDRNALSSATMRRCCVSGGNGSKNSGAS